MFVRVDEEVSIRHVEQRMGSHYVEQRMGGWWITIANAPTDMRPDQSARPPQT